MAESRDNSGTLGKNAKKYPPEGQPKPDKWNEKWPDYKGKCIVAGKEYWLSAWAKESKTGGKFLSLSFQDKDMEDVTTITNEDDLPF